MPGLLRSRATHHIPDLLGSVFTLCAHAHQRTSRQVLGLASLPADAPVFHVLETARDHLRSMALDWPQRLSSPVTDSDRVAWLRGCPLPIGGPLPVATEDAAWDALAALRIWLEAHILQGNVADWLALDHGNDAPAFIDRLASHAKRLLPARCLAQWLHDANVAVPMARSLDVLDTDPVRQAQQIIALGQDIATRADFAQTPTWMGRCAENGAWTRLRHRASAVLPPPSHALARRLASRWIDLLELASATRATDPAALLSTGTQTLGDGQTLAWCEMARGLLLHWVRRDAEGTVQDYKVVAPTEWNFHPQGTLSQALAILHAGDCAGAGALAAAFDPCVACTV